MSYAQFHLPVKPYNIIAAINRAAAATGSIRYATLAANADYNGHAIIACWNDFRKYYVCEYFWAGRRVVSRGNLEIVIPAAIKEYNQQGLGASLDITILSDDLEKFKKLNLSVIEGRRPDVLPDWYTWRHKEAGHALTLEKKLGVCATHALLCARDIEDYKFLSSFKGREELAKREIIKELLK